MRIGNSVLTMYILQTLCKPSNVTSYVEHSILASTDFMRTKHLNKYIYKVIFYVLQITNLFSIPWVPTEVPGC